jgi:hypothetical protein
MKKYRLGSPMPGMVRIVGVLLQLGGLYALINIPLQGVFLVVLGCIATYQWQGVEVDVINGKFRSYRSFMGIKTGTWNDLADFPFISVIKRNTSQRVYGQSMAGYDLERQFYSIILMNESHRVKFVLKNVEGSEQALKEAEVLARDLEREFVNYNPQVSARSRARRR